jgi:hypothetical protein
MNQLVDVLWPVQVTHAVRAEIKQGRPVLEAVHDQIVRRLRQQRLAAMSEIAQPRTPVDGRPDVVALVTQLHVAGVQRDPQADRREIGRLHVQRAPHRVCGAGEGDHEAVALALLDRTRAMMPVHHLVQQRIEARHRVRHRRRVRLPQPRRTLHIRQQQRHGAGRQPIAARVRLRFPHTANFAARRGREHRRERVHRVYDPGGVLVRHLADDPAASAEHCPRRRNRWRRDETDHRQSN